MNYKKYFEILGINVGTETQFICDSVMESLESLKNSSYSDKTNAIYQLCEGLNKDRMESLKGESHKCSEDIFNSHSGYFSSRKHEEFHIILFDNQHRVIEMKMVSKGILNKSLVHPREVFAPAIEKRAAAIVLVHNHPSGDPKPSKADFDITSRLKSCGELIGISILDHLIIAGGLYYSFVDESTI